MNNVTGYELLARMSDGLLKQALDAVLSGDEPLLGRIAQSLEMTRETIGYAIVVEAARRWSISVSVSGV